MPIHVLPPNVASQIAAGEVVERPASAVKELIENSLDAGATDVRVEIREGGRRLLRVSDNGAGISADEVELAFQRHATSKLSSAADLAAIRTLGFRGEALPSIAAVAQITLLTRHHDEAMGTQIRLEGGQVQARQGQGAPAGTVVTVENLFFNVPARLEFLRAGATEAGHVAQVVQRYALAYPECRFTFLNDGRLSFQTLGTGRLYDVLVKVFGLEMARQMIPIGEETEGEDSPSELPPVQFIRVTGHASRPELNRANRSYIHLFLNRRWIRDNSLMQAVVQAYHTFLPSGRFPVAVVMIELDPRIVDVNVHPAKSEVRFRDGRVLFRAVQKAVRAALVGQTPAPELNYQPTWALPGNWAARREALSRAGQTGRDFELPLENPLATAPSQSQAPTSSEGSETDGAEARAPTQHEGTGEPTDPAGDHSAGKGEAGRFPLLRVVGQLGGMYIIAEGPDGMYLIDQHAAHERILYERYMAERAGQEVAQQRLLEPLVISTDTMHAGLIGEHLEALQAVGFEIEAFGGDSFLVRAIPAILVSHDPRRTLEEMVEGLNQERDMAGEAVEEKLVRVICKRAAIKAGQALTDVEMRELVRQLEACRAPRACPHGRPTMLVMSASALERAFGRS